jgi:hypothetical protein
MPQPLLAQRPLQHDTGSLDENGAADLTGAWLAAMRAGDFAAAWAVSDAVLAARDPDTRDDPRLPYHLRWVWDGWPPDGKHVLVRCYHGLGDTLQFCRFLPLLRPRVASLTLEVQPELIGLLQDLPGPDRLAPFRPDAPLPPSECDMEIMELAHLLRVAPGPAPYLQAHPGPRPGPGLLAGVCWQAGGWDPGRSVPLPLLASLAQVPGVQLVSLQRGPGADDASWPGAPPLLLAGERGMEMADTARLLASLDLVVTVDTMVAHLAGALGRPAWVLLQAEADWRWMAGRGDSPWYPSLRLFRQDAVGDWGGVAGRLHGALAEWAANVARKP